MKKYIEYIITACVGIILTAFVFSYRGFLDEGIHEKIRIASDGTLLAGVLLLGIGLLCVISNEGFFDIFRYGMKCVATAFTPSKSRKRVIINYFDYKMQREEKKTGFRPLIIVGAIYFLLAVAFNILFAIMK